MLNSSTDIKAMWQGDALNIDDSKLDANSLTAYDRFLEKEAVKVGRRLKSWIGEAAYTDAALPSPADSDRAECIKESEMELMHVAVMEKLWRDKSAGVERDIQLPSGTRITLQAFNSDDHINIIKAHLANAERAVLDYLI